MSGPKGFFVGSRVMQAPPTRSLPQCGACGLFRKCTTPKMEVYGKGGRKVLFVGEAPSKQEDETGKHLEGKAGEFLRHTLRSMRFKIEADGWKTNAIICRPKGHGPTSAEVGYCRPNINRLIKELAPEVIVPMGQAAVAAVIGSIWKEDVGTMERWAGWKIPCQELNAWVCPTWPPHYILRMEDEVLERQFKTHLETAITAGGRPWPQGPPDWSAQVRRVLDPEKAARWLRKAAARQDGAIAWDYETNMLKPDGGDAEIASCAVAWGREEPEQCIAYPWHGEAITATQELLRSPIPKIASNLKFEDRWTRKAFGHRVRAWTWDTMLAAHVADNRQAITSVKFQGFVRHGIPVWNEKVEPFLKTKGDEQVNAIFREIDINDLLLYNGMDAIIEFRVAIDQMREIGYPVPWRI